MMGMQNFRVVPCLQAIYYFLTAVWPFIHLDSFLWITGEKTDIWLLKAVSLLLLPFVLLLAYLTFNPKKNYIIVGSVIIACLGLAGIDLYYSSARIIKWVYLIDGVFQLLFAVYWISYIVQLKNSSS